MGNLCGEHVLELELYILLKTIDDDYLRKRSLWEVIIMNRCSKLEG